MQTLYVAQTRPLESNSPLRYLWARARISRLSDFNVNGESEKKDDIVSLGLTYNLLTAYTSFIAVSEVRRNPGDSEDVHQPLPLPLHVSNLAVGMASVPEPELALLMAMVAATLLAGAAYRKWRAACGL